MKPQYNHKPCVRSNNIDRADRKETGRATEPDSFHRKGLTLRVESTQGDSRSEVMFNDLDQVLTTVTLGAPDLCEPVPQSRRQLP